ncbi:MAG: hypothetical protein ACTSO9_21295 [Candidatus Helarchaeota archaeon]
MAEYKSIIMDLQKKVKELREKNLKLEDKLLNTLSIQRENFKLTVSIPPDEERIYRVVMNFIKDTKKELIIITKSMSSDILDVVLEKLNDLEDITIVTNERHQIHIEDAIRCFDILASTPKIHHIINSNVNSIFIIKDKKEIILLSCSLLKAELTTKLNTAFKIMDKKIVEELWKFYKNHLPSFMR